MSRPNWNFPSPRLRKLITWLVVLIGLYALIGFLILPPIIRSVAARQIAKQLGREVSIQSIKINPFALSTTIRGLLIKDKDGQPFVSWDEVYVNFQLSSLFTHSLNFSEISAIKPCVRAEMHPDGTFNFSDIVAKFPAKESPATPKKATRPIALRIGHLQITGLKAYYADCTTRTPFKHTFGPLSIRLDDFRTDPDNKNPYAFSGTTDSGERISWNGYFYLDPLRSHGELKLFNLAINKYAPLYQDLVKFEIRNGTVGLDIHYRIDLSSTNRVCEVDHSAFGLRHFQLGMPGASNNIIDLPVFTLNGVNADIQNRQATVDAIHLDGAKIDLQRGHDASINVVEMAQPNTTSAKASGGVLLLASSLTNAVAALLQSTNQWSGLIRQIDLTNCDVHLEDSVNSRPAKLELSDISLEAGNLSNLAGTNLTAALSLHWNTNGSVKLAAKAALQPLNAKVQIDLDRLNLSSLDPYLEPKLNLFILDSQLNFHGQVQVHARNQDELPDVTFQGSTSLDQVHTVDGVLGEDLVKWRSLALNQIDASLYPPAIAIQNIILDDAYARLIIESNKTVNLLNALRLTTPHSPATNSVTLAGQTPATNAPALPKISIGAIIVTNSAITFDDRSIAPPVNLSVQDIDTTVAGLSSEQLQHADLNLSAKVDGLGPIDINGTLNPFSDQQTNAFKISFKDVDLTPISPYVGKFAGYRLAEGKLNLDLDYEIVGKRLDSKNVITLDQFTFGEKTDSPEATHLPVRLAVAIMKDRAGKIVLDVPVEGRLDDPQFRIRKVVLRAVVNILEKAATSPFTLLGAIFGGGGQELAEQDFALGSASLTATDCQKLDSLAKGLYERPGLNLEIVGSVDPTGDLEGLQRAALDREIRTRIWMKLRKTEQAPNSASDLVLNADDRAEWIETLYKESVAAGKITPESITANTNLAAYAAQISTRPNEIEKGAARLMNPSKPAEKMSPQAAGYHTKLVPPPSPMEAVLLTTYPVAAGDLDALATRRARAVQAYLQGKGNVAAARLFLKDARRNDGSRTFLQFR